jgi:hypothetical protein
MGKKFKVWETMTLWSIPVNKPERPDGLNVIVFDLERHYNRVLALRTAQAADLILDKNSTQSHDVLDTISLSGKEISINR